MSIWHLLRERSLLQQVFEHGSAAGLGWDRHRREGWQGIRDGLHQQVTSRAARAGTTQQGHGGGARGQERVGVAGSLAGSCSSCGERRGDKRLEFMRGVLWKWERTTPRGCHDWLSAWEEETTWQRFYSQTGRLPAAVLEAALLVLLGGGAPRGLMSRTESFGAGSEGVDSTSRNFTNISEKDCNKRES